MARLWFITDAGELVTAIVSDGFPVFTIKRVHQAGAAAAVEVWRHREAGGVALRVNDRGPGRASLWDEAPGRASVWAGAPGRIPPRPVPPLPYAFEWSYLEHLPQPAHPDLVRKRVYVAAERERAARRMCAGRDLWSHTFGNRDPIGAGECDGFVVAIDPTGSADAFTSRGATTNGGAIAALCSAGAVPIGDRSDLAALARVRGDVQGPLLAPVLVVLAA